jgi:hypothetical protein
LSPASNHEIETRLDKLVDRVTKLERYMIVLACAVASPKLGGPDPAALVGAVINLVS